MSNYMLPAPLTDATLTQKGVPADAKATGDVLGKRIFYPNYSDIGVLGSVGKFTIRHNGYFQLRASTNGANQASIFHRIEVNGWTVSEGYTLYRNYNDDSAPLLPVMVGAVVNVEGGPGDITYRSYLYNIRE